MLPFCGNPVEGIESIKINSTQVRNIAVFLLLVLLLSIPFLFAVDKINVTGSARFNPAVNIKGSPNKSFSVNPSGNLGLSVSDRFSYKAPVVFYKRSVAK
jgi:hypothetical protein